jgi:hypothetical protein
MPNHYHLLLRQAPDGSIQHLTQTVFNAYSQAVNKELNHSGTLFQGRSKSIHIQSDSYAIQLARYIHLNPVSAKLTAKPEEWEFSDYREWISESSSNDLGPFTVLRDCYFEGGKGYRAFVEAYREEKDKDSFLDLTAE